MQSTLKIFLSSSLLTWLAVLLITPFLSQKLMDTPNIRSSHVTPTPRGGGLAFVIVGTTLHLFSSTGPSKWVPLICLPLAIVGFIDDLISLPVSMRYSLQLLTAIGILSITQLSMHLILKAALVIFLTAIINFFNFMDGLDGLVAGCSVVLFASTSSWALSGAVFGFFLWNWSPAKVFMGDVGSTYIGSVFGGMLLTTHSIFESLDLFLVSLPLLTDAAVCLMRRYLGGENIFHAHKKHLFQRLNRSGWSHGTVAILYIMATILMFIAKLLGGLFFLVPFFFLILLIAYQLDRKFAIAFPDTKS